MKNNKNIIWFIVIVGIIIGYYFFINNNDTPKEESIKQEVISKEDIIIKDLTDKYQATVAIISELNYTIQAQEKFVTNKPTLFTSAYVEDIFKLDNKIFVRFSSTWFFDNDYILELECDKNIVDKILKQKGGNNFMGFDGEYVVVANIQKVSRPTLALKGSVLSEDEVEINLQASDIFTAKGTCVDVVFISNEE